MPLPLTVSCSSKIQIGFTFLVPAHLGSPGKRAVKRVCVCVCVCSFINVPPFLLAQGYRQTFEAGEMRPIREGQCKLSWGKHCNTCENPWPMFAELCALMLTCVMYDKFDWFRLMYQLTRIMSHFEILASVLVAVFVVVIECIYKLYFFSHSMATSSAECSRCSPPSSLVCGQLLTIPDIV